MKAPTCSARSSFRVMKRLHELAMISERPGMLVRRYCTPAHKEAVELVVRWMREAGMEACVDAAGNASGLYAGTAEDASAVLLGSHLDTVIDAGAYDGCLGVVAAIEAVALLNDQGIRLKHPVRVMGFADEEGTRFGVTYLGSAALSGTWNDDWLDATDADGVTMREAMRGFGLDPQSVRQAALPKKSVLCCYELHIEQGVLLENRGLALGAVTRINGSKRYEMRFVGKTGHAGTIPMSLRNDPMFGAAEALCAIERIAAEYGDDLYCTVGYVACEPNLANCIAGEVAIRLDFRAGTAELLQDADRRFHEAVKDVCARRRLGFDEELFFQSRLVGCTEDLVSKVRGAITSVQGCCFDLPSGAGHDSAELAQTWPMAMLFVRCKGGFSHCPTESISESDAGVSVDALLALLCDNY